MLIPNHSSLPHIVFKCETQCSLVTESKPGECPSAGDLSKFERACITSCTQDRDCAATEKCCVHQCGRTCQHAVRLDQYPGTLILAYSWHNCSVVSVQPALQLSILTFSELGMTINIKKSLTQSSVCPPQNLSGCPLDLQSYDEGGRCPLHNVEEKILIGLYKTYKINVFKNRMLSFCIMFYFQKRKSSVFGYFFLRLPLLLTKYLFKGIHLRPPCPPLHWSGLPS